MPAKVFEPETESRSVPNGFPDVTDIPFRKILGLNQQTYQRLRLSLTLHLRRQIFVAVCDDLALRDRMAAQLVRDLASPATRRSPQTPATEPYPRLVTLQLNLTDPNPLGQIAQWVSQSPPPRSGNRRLALPAFQFIGIEHLTRQPATIQRLFFAHLQSLEQSLPLLESGLLLWMTQPWFRALPLSAPDFWRDRTGTFEFIGDPTPTIESGNRPSEPIFPVLTRPATPPTATSPSSGDRPAPPPTGGASDDLWTILANDLAKLDDSTHSAPEFPPIEPPSQPPANEEPPETETHLQVNTVLLLSQNGNGTAQNGKSVLLKPTSLVPPLDLQSPPTVLPEDAEELEREAGGENLDYTETLEDAEDAEFPDATPVTEVTVIPAKPVEQRPVPKVPFPFQADVTATEVVDRATQAASLPLSLIRQIETLHQQNAPPAELTEAYRALGNFYRDRIELGETSTQNLQAAIHAYEQVLVWLHETSPVWTDVLNDLGNLYWMMSRHAASVDVALSYLQQGIQAYQLALSKLSDQSQSPAYPMLQNNLGSAYADLARYQNPVENLQRAIQAYQQTLRYRKPETDPLRYASTQNNLGTAYWSLAQHQQPVIYLKQAIAAYSEALQYYMPEEEAQSYAMIQNNLGTAYWSLAQHERPLDWLRLALGAYKVALKYRTLEVSANAYAATQNNLGTTFWHLATHTKNDPKLRSSYLKWAASAYEATLTAAEQIIGNFQAAPLNFDLFATHNNLGLAHYQIAMDSQVTLDQEAQSAHLEVALHHHLQALQGWQEKADLRQTAFDCLLQVVRAFYALSGIAGQNLALSRIPGSLLPELLGKL